ncbi:MAG: sulfatase-like hydrolase/transferase [Candidatus Zixiibacteriota bacterium]
MKLSTRPSLSKYLPSRPFVIIASVYIAGMVFFTVFRLLFLTNFAEYVSDEPLSEVLRAFLIGARFDQMIVLLALAPLILLLPWVKTASKAIRRTLIAYLTVVFSFFTLLLLTDIRFYKFFDSHLNFLAAEYLGDGNMAGNLIVTDPEFYRSLLVWLVITLLLLATLWLILRISRRVENRRSLSNQIVYFVLFFCLAVLGIRGRISLAPMDWGIAYFSQNRFLNQLALNGIYTLGRNLTEQNRDPRLSYLPRQNRFPFVDPHDALLATQKMLETDKDEWLDPDSSLLRLTRQNPNAYGFQPNVVIILSESWSAHLTSSLSGKRSLTPNFDRLATNGMLFDHFYASGVRTNFGIAATLCSFPSIPGRSIMKRYDARHPFVSLSEILDTRGYRNVFVYGGDLAFDNMEGFLREKKFHEFHGDKQLGRNLYFSKWGIPDHVLFEKAATLVDSLPRPFQMTILTLSNHEPWDLPDSTVRRYFDSEDSSKIFNSQIYADHSVGIFFDLMEDKTVSDSTVFVFVSDHNRIGPTRFILETDYFHIPLLIYSPALIGDSAVRVGAYGSQTDILPTLMGLLGDDYVHASWGRDIFGLPEKDSGFAVMNVGSRIAYIDNDYFYAEDLGLIYGFGTRRTRALQKGWFGDVTLEQLGVIGENPGSPPWTQVYLAMLDQSTRYNVMHVLNRFALIDQGYLYLQGTGGSVDSTLRELGVGQSAAKFEVLPDELLWARDRLRKYVQTAEQLSFPVEK